MANSRPRVNNAIKKQAREYQEAHPGTHYTAAREAVLNTSVEPQWSPSPLNRIIGQPEAKKQLHAVYAKRQFDIERNKRFGTSTACNPVRLFFVGPPGTGKSTAAYALHDALGTSEKFVQIGAYDLIGTHIGEPSRNVREVLDDVGKGTLVIDSVETLITVNESFRREVLATLIENMPTCGNLIVSGYTWHIGMSEEARRFVRLLRIVQFDTITNSDAADLAVMFAKEECRILSADALDAVCEVVSCARNKVDESGMNTLDLRGNVRFVRSLVESARHRADYRLAGKHGDNTVSISDDELVTITAEDVPRWFK
jgi:adenylate kinase family enzyme